MNEEIKGQIETTLDELGWKNLAQEKRAQIKQDILDSFDRVILDAVLMSIDDKQAEELNALIEKRENMEAMIAGFCSEISGLAGMIDLAVRAEWERWKEILDRRPKKEEAA